MKTEQQHTPGPIDDPTQLRQQRDELLAACKRVSRVVSCECDKLKSGRQCCACQAGEAYLNATHKD